MLAFVDASLGRVGQMIPIVAIPGYQGGPIDFAYVSMSSITSTRLANGRSRIVIHWSPGGWTEWTEGSRPRKLHLGYERTPVGTTLTRDGGRLLVSNPLSASGMICEVWSRQSCPPPKPVTGLIAALHSLPSGKQIWAIRGTATTMGGTFPEPAISPDGRFALIGIPTVGWEGRIALISMKDARILQTIRPPSTSEVAVSFSPDGSLVFVSGGSTVVVYKIKRS